MDSAREYRSAWWLALVFTLLSVALSVVVAIGVQVTTARIYLLDSFKFGANIAETQAKVSDVRERIVGIIQLSLSLIELVVFLMWVYRASSNCRALGATGMRYSPAWSVGWFFVPIAGLFMPYWVVKEVWQASSPPRDGKWRQTIVSPILAVWWLVCAVSGTIRYSRFRYLTNDPTAFALKLLSYRSDNIPDFGIGMVNSELEWSWGLMLGDLVGIAVSILTVVIVVTITYLQDYKHAVLADYESGDEVALSTDGVGV